MGAEQQWTESAQQFQKMLAENFQKAVSALVPGSAQLTPGLMMQAMPPGESIAALQLDPAKVLDIQQEYLRHAT